MTRSIFIIIVCLSILYSKGQSVKVKSRIPEVGKPLPDFLLKEVHYYSKNSVTNKDFRGKWLIMDFWTRHCAICEASIPITDSLQRKYFDKVQFVLYGYTGSQYAPWLGPDGKYIRGIYEKIRKKAQVELPIAYDSVLFHRFDIGACPFIIIVDPQGIVQGITYDLKEADILQFLANKHPDLPKVTPLSEEMAARRKRDD